MLFPFINPNLTSQVSISQLRVTSTKLPYPTSIPHNILTSPIKKMWYICIMEYYPAIKRNKTGSFVEMWMDLESVL